MTAVELLNQILRLFLYYKNNVEMLNYLIDHDIIKSNFERRYLLNNVDHDFKIINIIHKKDDLVVFYLEASDGSPYKVEMIFEKKWYLKSFLFQCQSCFGDDKHCPVCGGSGWGVL